MYYYNNIRFTRKEEQEIKQIIEAKNPCDLFVQQEISGVWLHSENPLNELRILFLFKERLTISRVCFENQREGTMTDILNYLISFCKKHEIKRIVVQSVCTSKMADFCLKNGIMPNEFARLHENGFLFGDYELEIKEEN